jgi:hypothetical protein
MDVMYLNGSQSVAYALTVTPNPFMGGKVYLATITGNLTIANPAEPGAGPFPTGAKLVFDLPVNAIGGYTLAFGTAYKLVGAAAPALAANTTVLIGFLFDGTNWRETERTIT